MDHWSIRPKRRKAPQGVIRINRAAWPAIPKVLSLGPMQGTVDDPPRKRSQLRVSFSLSRFLHLTITLRPACAKWRLGEALKVKQMAENSGIGWTDHTQNFWWGCHKVSAECTHCYIDGIMRRAGRVPFGGPMKTVNWSNPHRWERQAQEQGRRFRVFTCSMSDFFHPGADEWRDEAWEVIRQCPSLDWLILTKRPELIVDRLPADWRGGYANVWLGVTCGVASSLHRLDKLKSIPAVLRWVSAEPLLGPIDFQPYLDGSFHWIITGCEQAGVGKRRELGLDWVRDIDQQCRVAGVAHFFKQRYEGSRILHDGLLDGEIRQAWPQ